jgi:hypothetical protein
MSGMTSPSYNQDFLLDTLGITQEFLSDIINDSQAINGHSSGKEFFWHQKIAALTGNISQFVEITTLLSRAVMKKKQKSLPLIKESHLQLLYIVKAMNQAMLKQDDLVLEELIKYELKDNLTQWKIDLIPQIKKLLTS